MDVLPLNFRTLWLCGIWYEENEKLTIPRIVYRCAVIVLQFYYTFTLSAEIFFENSDISELMDALFLAMTYITMCMKILNFVFRRAEMIDILNDLRHPYCKPNNIHESEILDKYSRTARNLFIYLLIYAMSVVVTFVSPFIFNLFNNVMELPYKTYQFYNISTKEAFLTTAAVQVITVLYSICINISFDTLTAGLLILMTGQLELNACRLSKLNQSSVVSMNDCIAHNALINGTMEKVESFIIGIVIPFLFFSLLSICASIFQLSEYSIFSLEFLGLLSFAIGILLQVLLYCWFGNELMLKNEAITTAAYNSDWVSFDPQKRKILQVLMLCNKEGRTISYGGQCSLTLDTYVWILKTCYATISLLRQMNG